jgi:hypothetical protein
MIESTLDTSRRKLAGIALATLLVVSAGAAVAFTASAAGSTTVSVAPDERQVAPGATTTYEVVVENTDSGIGTTNANVGIEDTAVGSITNVTIAGNAANQNVSIAADGSSASFSAIYFGDALPDDPGGVTIATVTVTGNAAGSSDLSLDVTEISDSAGEVYDVTGTDGASLTVSARATATPTGTATPSGNATPTEAATPTEPATPAPDETASNATGGDGDGGAADDATGDPGDDETAGEGEDGDGRPLDRGSIADSLSESGLTDTQVDRISEALAASDLSDAQITTITDALAGDGLTAEQRRAVSDAIAGGLSDQQLAALSEALRDGRLTDAERETLGFLAAGTGTGGADGADGEATQDGGGDDGSASDGKAKRPSDGGDRAAGGNGKAKVS